MIKKLLIICTTIFLGISTIVYAAPTYTFLRTILPEANSLYDIGTSTNAFRIGYFNQLCLTADSCKTAWPTGGSGGSYPFTTSTNFATTTSATSTPLWLRGNKFSLFASSTSVFEYASTTALSISGTSYLGTIASGVLTGATGLPLTTGVTGILPFANGGTGLSSASDDTVMVSNGSAWQAKTLTDCDAATSAVTYDTTANAFGCNTISGGGGGSGGGTFSTTTSQVSGQLVNYPNNTTDILAVGSNSTTTAKFWFDPNVPRFFLSGNGTTTGKFTAFDEIKATTFWATSTTATSTLPRLSVQTALNLFGTFADSLDDLCVAITGSSALCDGSDATGGAGGSGNVATSTAETSDNVAYWTSTSATPATLGSDSGLAYNATIDRLTVPYASTTALTVSGTSYLGTIASGVWNGTAVTVPFGGTGASTLTGLLLGNGTSAITGITGTAGQYPFYSATNVVTATSTVFLATTGNVGIGTTTPGAKLTLTSGSSVECPEVLLATSTSMTIDWNAGCNQLVRMGTSATTLTHSNVRPGMKLLLGICNPGATSGAITFAGSVSFSGGLAPSHTTTANQCDYTSWYGSQATSTTKAIFQGQQSGFQ